MATYSKDERVDNYINGLPLWQQTICHKVRDLVHLADPDVDETTKRTVQPYFALDGNICALLAAKDHVNVFIYDPIAPDPEGIINQGHENATARAIQIAKGDEINEKALLNLFKAVIANNRAGGWRKLQGQQDSSMSQMLRPGILTFIHFCDTIESMSAKINNESPVDQPQSIL